MNSKADNAASSWPGSRPEDGRVRQPCNASASSKLTGFRVTSGVRAGGLVGSFYHALPAALRHY